MTTLIKLAWRNIWRNKRRTLITVAAITFAVFLASFQVSFQKGAWDNIVDSSVNMFYGFAQVRGNGYTDEQTLDKAFLLDEQINKLNVSIDQVEYIVPRLESFALASHEESTRGVLVIGIDPEKEDQMTGLSKRLKTGEYLKGDDEAAFVASGLAEKLKLDVGDTLVIISQGYHGVNAAGKYPIKGIFEFALPDLNKRLIYLPLAQAQIFYGAENRATTLALKINDRNEVPEAILALNKELSSEEYEVKSWQELVPELLEARQLDTAGGVFILALLYVIIFFGIFGTILMMTKEREYEFGVLTAIGMSRWKLFTTVWIETVTLGLLGSLVGILLSIPLCYYTSTHPFDVAAFGEEAAKAYEKFGIQPILQGTFEWGIFFDQAFIIFLATSILAIYPLSVIMRLKPVEAMRG